MLASCAYIVFNLSRFISEVSVYVLLLSRLLWFTLYPIDYVLLELLPYLEFGTVFYCLWALSLSIGAYLISIINRFIIIYEISNYLI